MSEARRITDLQVFDVRFPTSLEHDGSDATHPDPDYSACYVVIKTGKGFLTLVKINFNLWKIMVLSILEKILVSKGAAWRSPSVGVMSS
jgi:hypothetical protein